MLIKFETYYLTPIEITLEKLQIIVHKSHVSSIKVAKNCNFEWHTVLKAEFTPFHEHPLDMELYELSTN